MTNFAGRLDVRAAAQLDTRPERDHPHLVAVILPFHIDSAPGDSLRKRHDLDRTMIVATDQLVHSGFDVRFLRLSQSAAWRIEVKTRVVRVHGTSPLRNTITKNLLERSLEQVRDAMVAANLAPPRRIDDRVDRIAN